MLEISVRYCVNIFLLSTIFSFSVQGSQGPKKTRIRSKRSQLLKKKKIRATGSISFRKKKLPKLPPKKKSTKKLSTLSRKTHFHSDPPKGSKTPRFYHTTSPNTSCLNLLGNLSENENKNPAAFTQDQDNLLENLSGNENKNPAAFTQDQDNLLENLNESENKNSTAFTQDQNNLQNSSKKDPEDSRFYTNPPEISPNTSSINLIIDPEDYEECIIEKDDEKDIIEMKEKLTFFSSKKKTLRSQKRPNTPKNLVSSFKNLEFPEKNTLRLLLDEDAFLQKNNIQRIKNINLLDENVKEAREKNYSKSLFLTTNKNESFGDSFPKNRKKPETKGFINQEKNVSEKGFLCIEMFALLYRSIEKNYYCITPLLQDMNVEKSAKTKKALNSAFISLIRLALMQEYLRNEFCNVFAFVHEDDQAGNDALKTLKFLKSMEKENSDQNKLYLTKKMMQEQLQNKNIFPRPNLILSGLTY